MKVEIQKDQLAKQVSFAERIAAKNASSPVLGAILLSAKDTTLTLSATNIDLSFEAVVPAKVSTPGIVAIPASFLNNFISNLYDTSTITFELSDGNLSVKTNHSSSVVKAIPHAEFPAITRISEGKQEVIGKGVAHGLKSVWWAATATSIKPELSSVYLYHDGDTAVFVATDSFRLAEKRIKMKKAAEIPSILIPHKNVSELIRFLDQVKDTCDMYITNNQLALATDNMYISSRVVDAAFPDYKQIVPKDVKTEVTLLTQDFMQSCKLLQVFTDKFNQTIFSVVPNAKKVTVKTKNADLGETEVKLDGTVTGEPVEMSFNHRYITDIFGVLNTESIQLVFNGMARPLVMRGVGDNTFMYLVMPMNK
jgi:DNA polymerase III subunit beta